MAYPNMKQALELFDTGMVKMSIEQPKFTFYVGKPFKSHCCLVACCAEIIASRLPHIDGQKAYILGLLHDYGKMVVDAENKDYFHGLTGYQALTKLGWDEAAKICLSHTFPDKEFKLSEYSYPPSDLRKSRQLLKSIEYDDYDKLIQLCDLLVVGMGFSKIKDRMIFVRNKYKVPTITIKKKYRDALNLKHYFDKICGCDIYKLLGVN